MPWSLDYTLKNIYDLYGNNVTNSPTSQAQNYVTFRLSGGGGPTLSLILPINPEEIQGDAPVRQTTTQTMGGIYKDIKGIGIQSLTIQGNTGWRKSSLTGLDGFQTAKQLWENIYKEYYRRFQANPDSPPELLFINGIDQYTYKITIDDFQTFRTKSESLLFRYSLSVTVLKDMADPPPPSPDPIKVKTVENVTKVITQSIKQAVPPAPPAKPAQRWYSVEKGESLWVIAQWFYGDGSKFPIIAQANNITPPYIIYPNQQLLIPNPTYHG